MQGRGGGSSLGLQNLGAGASALSQSPRGCGPNSPLLRTLQPLSPPLRGLTVFGSVPTVACKLPVGQVLPCSTLCRFCHFSRLLIQACGAIRNSYQNIPGYWVVLVRCISPGCELGSGSPVSDIVLHSRPMAGQGGTLVSFKLHTVILLVVTFHLGKLRHRKMK